MFYVYFAATSQTIISFSAEYDLYISCDQLPGSTIKIIDSTFGSADPSCPRTDVSSKLSDYSNGKTSVMLRVLGEYFGGLCPTYKGPVIMNGKYTCIPSNNPGLHGIQIAIKGLSILEYFFDYRLCHSSGSIRIRLIEN